MGNINENTELNDPIFDITLDKKCYTAGTNLTGSFAFKKDLNVGELLAAIEVYSTKFKQLYLQISFIGTEKMYWVPGYSHHYSQLVNIPDNIRRTNKNLLIDFNMRLNKLDLMELKNLRVSPQDQYQFTVPLPGTLPSTFLYHGDNMS